jgi:hypothetical protein
VVLQCPLPLLMRLIARMLLVHQRNPQMDNQEQ